MNENFEDTLGEALSISVLSYNPEVTKNLWDVLQLIYDNAEPPCCDEIALTLNLAPTHVELIQYLICNNDNAEYGTSPRCCWLTDKGRELVEKLRTMLI